MYLFGYKVSMGYLQCFVSQTCRMKDQSHPSSCQLSNSYYVAYQPLPSTGVAGVRKVLYIIQDVVVRDKSKGHVSLGIR